MKNNKVVRKSLAAAVISLGGIGAVGNLQSDTANAAAGNNVYHVYQRTKVYSNYRQPVANGQILRANSSWKIIRSAHDAQGNTWYDLGCNQWVKVVNKPVIHRYGTKRYRIVKHYYYRPRVRKQYRPRSYAQPKVRKHYRTRNYAVRIAGTEASAKNWIAMHESGGSYSARNGRYIGRYQLSASYLHGDYSPANQERTANRYVHSRYGSWTKAKTFWEIHGWY